ncbi:nitrous oxide reductase accessory protein NosL [Shewanella insulae]|uniref:nitrous oxide reductase accessory protein NosL n=1 Tax=Shewanella insulae TaxID=2681496 RepID=UPI001EFC4497|nr:nitrous oxide reductase accessory protein NosL [Shewanella insulae]MCG9754363.1 nitrous oxide reductase accessory protein NosL [Shewanella insulae]
MRQALNSSSSLFVSLFCLLLLGLSACGQESENNAVREAVAIEHGDECHLCGMLIGNFPGPKGELYLKTEETVKKFCSTRDLFSFLLDPEYRKQVKEIYVHDMARSPWQAPQDSHFIDARQAWYVVGSSQTGAMGKTLASFGEQKDAEAFAAEFGGQVYPFGQISLSML